MKSTAYLTIIMTINWIFEIISFYNETSSTLFDIINALQGVLIFLMFVCMPRPLRLIESWWKDRGSFQVLDNKPSNSNDIQMTSLCQQWVRQERRTSEGDDENLNKRNYARRNHKMKLFVGTITLIYVGSFKFPGISSGPWHLMGSNLCGLR